VNITSEPTKSSLAQRIAKVRNCMLVEAATGISATNKTLFVSLCQIYEHQSIVTSCPPDESPQSSSHQVLSSFPHLTAEGIQPHDFAATSGKDTPSGQHRFGFSVISWPNLTDFDDWADWDDKS
jgi:hypothetical protein